MRFFKARAALYAGVGTAVLSLGAGLAHAQDQSGVDFAVSELGLTEELVNAACEEGNLTIYHLVFRSELREVFSAFNERFPCITIDTFMASGGPLAQRFTTELQAGVNTADVWMSSTASVALRMAEEGALDSWVPPTAELIDAPWRRDGAFYGVGLAHIGVAWNHQEVSETEAAWLDELETWEQVFDAPFVDNAGMVDVRAGGTTQLPYFYFRETFGEESWEKLRDLHPTIFNAVAPMTERLGAGEFAFAPHAVTDTGIANAWAQGAPLRWKFPEPGLAVPYFVSIPAQAPHPNASKLFVAWSLSAEGQTKWVNDTGLAPASEHGIDNRVFAQESWYALPKTHYDVDWLEIEANLDLLSERFQAVFGQ